MLDRPAGQRVVAKVTVTDAADPAVHFEGSSKDPTADMNNHLSFEVDPRRTYAVEAEYKGAKRRQSYTAGEKGEDLLNLFMSSAP